MTAEFKDREFSLGPRVFPSNDANPAVNNALAIINGRDNPDSFGSRRFLGSWNIYNFSSNVVVGRAFIGAAVALINPELSPAYLLYLEYFAVPFGGTRLLTNWIDSKFPSNDMDLFTS